ncbi:hypothetical protein ACIBEJ_09730 [Nonomuraea sp. NPDC050790]|uniref:hypothetical protein n=1 Tax=Nonomuraea sp. NPDC050790 TaxID=3364371 RepID=UPI00379F7DFA
MRRWKTATVLVAMGLALLVSADTRQSVSCGTTFTDAEIQEFWAGTQHQQPQQPPDPSFWMRGAQKPGFVAPIGVETGCP